MEAPAEDLEGQDGEGKDKWNPEDYKWTVTNRQSKNLPQLFMKSRGVHGVYEVKQASEYGHNRLLQTAESLDKFIEKVQGA